MGWGKSVIVSSNVIGRHMIDDFGVPYERIRLIPRSVDLERFKYISPDKKRLKEFNVLLDTFAYIFPIDRKASTKAAEIAGKLSRDGKSIGHTDALIAGSLLANGCNKFLTNNKKEFENIPGLEVL